MVTPLSSRIIDLEAKVKIKNASNHKHVASTKLPWQLESRRKYISGYTSDTDSHSQIVPAKKRFRAEQVEANAKRRKIEEENFQAHNIKKDLANANSKVNTGVKYSPRARNLANDSIDISNVNLVMAKDYRPDIVRDIRLDWNMRAYNNSFSAYASLIDTAKPFYKDNGHRTGFQRISQWKSTHRAFDTASRSTGESSSLNIDNEYEYDTILTPSALLGQNELLERQSAGHDDAVFEKSKQTVSCSAVTRILTATKTDSMTLESALIDCQSTRYDIQFRTFAINCLVPLHNRIPFLIFYLSFFFLFFFHIVSRLLVQADAPHYIVHVSAAFSKLSGIPSGQLVGSSLATFLKVMEDDETVEVDISRAAEMLNGTNDSNHNQTQQSNKYMRCNISIHRALSYNGTGEYYHFALDFKKINSSSSSSQILSTSSNKVKKKANEKGSAKGNFTEATTVIG